MNAHWLGLVACLLLVLGSGCDGCNRPPEPVPFGKGRTDEPDPQSEPETKAEFTPKRGTVLDPGTRDLVVAGGRYTTPRGAIHLALRLDLDGDEDEDALLVVSHETALTLVAVKNDRGVLSTSNVGSFQMQEGCLYHEGSIEQVAPDNVVLGLQAKCPFGDASATAMITLVPSPRIRKKLWLEAPSEGSEPPLQLVASSVDRDEDGHLDLVVAVLGELTPPVELVWLNRPGGFSLVDDEPKTTLEGLFETGRSAKEADLLLDSAARLRALSSALCREASSPRLRVDEAPGIPCGRDYVGLAETLRVAALLEARRFDEAIQLDRELRDRGDRAIVAELDRAWGAVRSARIPLKRIADAPRDAALDEWTAGLGFDDEGGLILRGLLTQRFTFQGGEAKSEIILDRGLPITDLEGRFAVESVVRDCASVRARIIPLDPSTGAPRQGGLRREVEIAPPDEECERGASAPRTWEVLGWTPQGLVARNGARRRVIPLSIDAEPSGEPFELGDDEPLPSPIVGPHVTRDGSTVLDSVPGAVLLLREGAAPAVLRDESWGDSPTIRTAAISPDGKRIAIVVDAGLYVGSL